METMTTKEALDRAWHILNRLHGVRILTGHKINSDGSSLAVGEDVPDGDEAKLGMLAQRLYDVNPSSGDDSHKMIYAASAAVGYPIKVK